MTSLAKALRNRRQSIPLGKKNKPQTLVRRGRARRALAVAFGLFLVTGPAAFSAPITYVFSGTISGSVGTTTFTNASVSIVAVGDTATVTAASGVYCNNLTSVAVENGSAQAVPLVGTFSVFDNTGFGNAGIRAGACGAAGFDWSRVSDSAFNSYNLATVVGPIPVTPTFTDTTHSLNSLIGPFILTSQSLTTFQTSTTQTNISMGLVLPHSGGYAYVNNGPNNWGSPLTILDSSHGAEADGMINTATIHWGLGTCSGAFKLKICHSTGSAPGSWVITSERGPFDAAPGYVTVTLTPPVPVLRGDNIALTQLGGSSCGGVLFTPNTGSDITYIAGGLDPAVGSTVNAATITVGAIKQGETMGIRAGTSGTYLSGVLAAAGTVPGGGGSFFRTSLQLTNPENGTIAGKLVYHPAATSGTSNDPSLAYSLTPGQTTSYADVVAQMGQSGLGSLDVMVTSGTRPVASAHVFNDQGAAGTDGFFEDLIPGSQAMSPPQSATLQLPDFAKYRVNIGVRTLADGATILVSLFNADGTQVPLVSVQQPSLPKTYQPTYFEQAGVAGFLGGVTPPSGGSINISVTSGHVIVYASTTDNITNDSSVRFAGKD